MPVVTATGDLDEHAARVLLDSAARLTSGGPVLIRADALTGWTEAGVTALADPGQLGQLRPALIAPPAHLLASSPAAAQLDMYPSADTAAAVLSRPPGALPLPPAGADAPARWAHRMFTAEPSSVFTARHWIRDLLSDWGCRPAADSTLVAFSELASGVLAHDGADLPTSAYLWRDHDAQRMLTVSVLDANPDLGTHRSGLRLVATLADHLGCYRQTTTPAGKILWFTMRLPTPPSCVSTEPTQVTGGRSC
ncbi:ATP-binding protein [Catellatospora chokoriensis]|nr:hypothetical protein [Catellatospora chokoriensis]